MPHSRVASRYVKSLLDLAVQQGALEPVHQDMQLFNNVCRNSREFVLMLKSPIIRHEKKRAVLETLFKGKVHPLTMGIIDILTKKNREPLLPAIASEFHVAYNDYKGIGKASIVSTQPLDARLRSEIESLVKQLSHKKEVELEERVDKDLIGGFILNVGDRQIDASVKSKLKALKLKFSENPYVKEF
ncbi:MAG: ATP synthase F1 subunit delta [Cyclobacteriaceae bacterium]|nr:ATP synthase F1 subunit delta [Cyclobacteriaceae bacterium]